MAEVHGSPEPLNIPDRNEKEILPPGPMSLVFEILGTDSIAYQTVPDMFSRPLKMATLREDNEIREELTKFIKMTREIYPVLSEKQAEIIHSLESIINKTITLPGDGGITKAPIDRKLLNEKYYLLEKLYDVDSLNRNEEAAIPILKKILESFSFVPGVNPLYLLLHDLDLPKERLLEVGYTIKDENIKMEYFSNLHRLGKITEEESLKFAESISDPILKSRFFLSLGFHYVLDFFDRNILEDELSNEQREEFFQTLMNKSMRIQDEERRDLLLTQAIFKLNIRKLFQESARIIPAINNTELKRSLVVLVHLTENEKLSLENAIELTSKIEDEGIRTKALRLIFDRYRPSKTNENFASILAIFDTIYKKSNRSQILQIINTLH